MSVYFGIVLLLSLFSLSMGQKNLTLQLPTDYTEDDIRRSIKGELGLTDFSFHLSNKSLDARKRSNIHWLINLVVISDQIADNGLDTSESLQIRFAPQQQKIIIIGSGPAGFFSAFALQSAGFETLLIERGSEVNRRQKAIHTFESGNAFDASDNYAFGEGGAGTFSDGKLTSRSKHISAERRFILKQYIAAGGPHEIAYLAHPHLGTDNLRQIVVNLRKNYESIGGKILFNTLFIDLLIHEGKKFRLITNTGDLDADAVFIAPGHSAFETYRMLMRRGVPFRTKGFALGSRMEHPQELINQMQWGQKSLPGVKAAEYRLTSEADGKHPVYSFCMCPGGMVVPATAYAHTNIVNGMSHYSRSGSFANAACVAGIHPDGFAGKKVSPLETLDLLEQLEARFFTLTKNYAAPVCSISDFIQGKNKQRSVLSSYPLGLEVHPLWEYLPKEVTTSMRAGLKDFSRKMNGFETGLLIGLESKTSSSIQVIRDSDGQTSGIPGLYIVGEGSGYAGGIVSSAADGLKIALQYIRKNQKL